MKFLNILIIVLVVFAVSVDFYRTYTAPHMIFLPESKLGRIIFYFSFFTVLSNISCAISSYYVLKDPFYIRNRVIVWRINTVLCMLITAIVYNIMLRGIHQLPNLISHISNELLHIIIPFLLLISWLCYDPHPRLTLKIALCAMIAPLVYVFYMFISGAITGYYQYPMFNVNQLGLMQPLITAVVIAIIFICLLAIFYKIDQYLGNGQKN